MRRTLGGWGRLVVVAAVALALAAVLPVMLLVPFGRVGQTPTVEVDDGADIVDAATLRRDLGQVRFREPVHLAVLTLASTGGDSLNDAVLRHARTATTEVPWIAASDPDHWADGLVILAVAPAERQVGTYFGEDVAVDLGTQSDIQDAMKDDFRAGDWADGLVAGARAASGAIGRPAVESVWARVLGGLASALGVGLGAWTLERGRRSRRDLRLAQTAYAEVTGDYEGTQLAAATIPASEPYGARVLARHRAFEDRYIGLTRSFLDLGSPSGPTWYEGATRRATRDLLRQSRELDAVDDAIVHAADLFALSGNWRGAWDNETGPVGEDLEALEDLATKVRAAHPGSSASRVQDWVRRQGLRLDAMGQELGTRSLTPSAALAELDRLAAGTRQQALALAREALGEDRSAMADRRREDFEKRSWAEKPSPYTGTWTLGGTTHHYDPASTIREHVGTAGIDAIAWQQGASGADRGAGAGWPVIVGTGGSGAGGSPQGPGGAGGRGWPGAGSASTFVPVSGLVIGYTHASTLGDTSSGAGGSSGGFSGGGFSGSGSSSGF